MKWGSCDLLGRSLTDGSHLVGGSRWFGLQVDLGRYVVEAGLFPSPVHFQCPQLSLEVTSVTMLIPSWRQETIREVEPFVHAFIPVGNRKYVCIFTWVSL